MRLTLNSINAGLKRLGHDVELTKGDGYFFVNGGESVDWLDRTVRVSTVGSLTLEQWVEEFQKLKKLNEGLLHAEMPGHETRVETKGRPVKKGKK